MIEYKKGDLLKTEAEALVNTVNCVGIMGKGIALQFKKAYPDNYKAYKQACDEKKIQIGSMFVFTTDSLVNPKYIINFPTKQHWKSSSKLENIEKGLKDLVKQILDLNIRSIAVPSLGCGCGGLDWNTVRKLIEKEFSKLENVSFIVFEPIDAKQGIYKPSTSKRKSLTPSRALLLALCDYFIKKNHTISSTDIHQLAFFIQEAGEELKLKFTKETFGLYAKNLNKVINDLQKKDIIKIEEKDPHTKSNCFNILPEAMIQIMECLNKYQDKNRIFNKVLNMIKGYESSYHLSLLSKVFWIIEKEKIDPLNSVKIIEDIKNWNDSKEYDFADKDVIKALHHVVTLRKETDKHKRIAS